MTDCNLLKQIVTRQL